MAKGYNVRTGGNPGVSIGVKNINSWNVKPTTVAAAASPGTPITVADTLNYEMFTVSSGGATERVTLPSTAEVGTVIVIHALAAARAYSIASSGVGINGGTDAQYAVLAANSTTVFTRVSATRWIATQFAAAGTVTAPTPT